MNTLPPNRRLSLKSLEYLAALPLLHHLDYDDGRIALAHGTPWSPYVSLFTSDAPADFHRAVREAASDVLVVGHTHAPMHVRCEDTLVINPGSVWQNHPRWRQYGWRTCAIYNLKTGSLRLIDIDTGTQTTLPVILVA